MTAREPILDPVALRRLAPLELVARQVVEGTFSGLHRSPVHGFSVEFLQHRPYSPGDDLRHLDWKVFGKSDRHFVRQYQDETTLRATLLLDASGSMGFASGEVSKLHYAVRLAAAIAYVLGSQQDAVGLLVFDRVERKLLLPRSGRRQLKRLFDELESVEAGGETALAPVMHDLVSRIPHRGLVIILTDAFDDVPALLNALTHFQSVHHEVLLFQILDRQEVEFGFDGWTKFECLEVEDQELLLDPAQVRRIYVERFRSFQGELRRGCHDRRIDFIPIITDRPYDQALASYLALRGARK